MTNHTFRFSAVALLIGALFSPSQSALAATVDVDTVTVTASDISTRTERASTYKSSAMSTTTGLALSPRETPQSVSNVTMTQMEDQGISSLTNAMRNTTGVTVIPNSGQTRFLSRGFYIDQIQEDGISSTVSGGASGNPYRDSQSLSDMAIYDHIEVVRGPTGLTQSNSEPGGTINAVRKKPTSQFQASASAEVGSWETYRGVGDISGSLNEAHTLRGRFVGVLNQKGSFKDDVGEKSGTAYAVVEADLTPDTLLTFGAMYQHKKETPDYFGVPMAPDRTSLGLDRDSFFGFDWQESKFTKNNVFAELDHYFNDEWRINAKVNYLNYRADMLVGQLIGDKFGSNPSNPQGHGNNFLNYDNSGWQASGQITLNGVYPLLGRKHDVFATFNYTREHSDSRFRRVMFSDAFDLSRFVGNEVPEPDWDNVVGLKNDTSYDADLTDIGLLLGTRFNISDKWHLIAGGRYAQFKSEGHTYYDIWNGKPDPDPTVYSTQTTTKFIPYGGLTWDITDNSSLYASYTSIFKPQSDRDESSDFLDPVTGENYELGLKSEWFQKRLNTSIAIFQLNQKNRAFYPDSSSKFAIASGEVRSRGFEAEINGQLTPGWNVFAGYTFNTSKYKKQSAKEKKYGLTYSPYTPKHMLRLYSTYQLPGAASNWTIGGGVRYQSATRSVVNIDSTSQVNVGSMTQGGYAVFDASVHYQVAKNIKASFIVNNLFDREYYVATNNRALSMNNFYGDPRNFLFRLTATY